MVESDAGGEPLTELELEILLALGRGPLHGYGVITDVEERTGGRVTVRSGTLYATLRRMTREGLVEPTDAPCDDASSDSRRKYYRLTAAGRRAAAAEAARLRSVWELAVERGLAPDPGQGG